MLKTLWVLNKYIHLTMPGGIMAEPQAGFHCPLSSSLMLFFLLRFLFFLQILSLVSLTEFIPTNMWHSRKTGESQLLVQMSRELGKS